LNYAGKFDAALPLDGQGFPPASGHIDSFTAKAHGHVPDGAVVIADPNLIFHGEFKRTGLDLVLSHDGHDVVVHDYFRGDKRAAIASPDGAHLTGDIVSALTGYVQVAQAAPGAAAAQVIGHVTKLTGSATAIRNGVSVVLNNGDNVEKGDVVSTGSESTLGITFVDGTVFGLSSNARMVLNEMVYDPNGSNNSSLLSLVAGTITFVAGETAKHGDMKIDTPVATMGIRGTAVLTEISFVVPSGGGEPQPQANFQVLVEPNGTTGSYILFDKLTLLPIATVNQAGQMIQISGGNVSVTNALLSPDVQKLITDVFTLKFTDNNTNTKLTTNFTDTITQSGNIVVIKTDTGATATATFNTGTNNSTGPSQGGHDKGADRFPGPPHATSLDANGNVTSSFTLKEHAGATADRADATGDPVGPDTVVFRINFVDQNLGDRPTVSVDLGGAPNYVYMDAGKHDVTGSLTALQKQDIAATQIQINVAADAGNANNGSATLTYTIPDHAFDFLAEGETLTLTYMVRVNDNFAVNPESNDFPITITITGTNDKPTVATSGGTVIEKVGTGNTALDTISGAVSFTDVDLTDRPIVSAALSTTQPFKYLDAHGHDITSSLTPEQLAAVAAVEVPLTVVQGAGNSNNGSATWTYSVPDRLFDFLADGETLVLNYVIQVDDGHGGVVNTPITVSINGADVSVEGTNDVPTIVAASTTPTGAVKEDAAATLSAAGTVTFNDPDLTDTHTASFALKSTASTAHLPGFADNASHIGTFALTEVSENPGVSTVGSVGWSFTLDDNDPVLQSLAEGQTITQIYTITIDDHHGGTVTQDVTVVITGTNDAPTITSNAAAAAGGVTEDAATPTLSTGGTLAIQDLDLIDTHTAAAVFKSSASSAHLPGFSEGTGHIGTFTIDPSVTESNSDTDNGATLGWHFSLADNDPVLQSLAEGQTITQIYTVTFTDNHGAQVSQDVTVVITGTNDAPTITSNAAAAMGGVTEDAATPTLSTGGTLAIQDLDLIDTHTAAAVFKSSASSAHLPGFSEGTSHIGSFTIDPAVTESNSDTDNGATLGWHFSLADNDPVLQSLAEGQTITQIYTVTFTDNHGATVSQDVTVVITGTNDAPTITSNAAAAAGAVTEDTSATLSTGGTLAIQDLDLIDTHTAAAVFKSSASSAHLPGFSEGTGHIGTFTIDPSVTESNSDTDNGATLGWHFSLADNDPVLQSLAEGQTITQIYTVTFTDNHGATVSQDVTVVITGTNDAPTITSNAAAAMGGVTEDAATPTLSTGGTLAIQDLDLIDTHTAAAVFKSSASSAHLPGFSEGTGHIGTFTIDPAVTESNSDTDNGATLGWHFSLADNDPVLQSLAEGQTITQIYTVTFTDNHGATVSQDVTVVITGTNDAPTITSNAAAAKGGVTEDAATPTLSTGGTLAIQDLDLIDTHTAAAVFKSSVSSAHLPGFSEGTSHIGTFTIDPSVTESNSDTDNGATLGWHFSLADNDPVLQSLAEGQTITQVYTVTFTDNHGATVSQDVTITINGANDAPTITSNAAAAAGAVTEDTSATLSIDGTLAIQDLDLIDTHTASSAFKSSTSSVHLAGFSDNTPLGTFTIDPAVTELNTDTNNGATLGWHFSLDNGNAVLQSLAQGQSITEVYTVTFTDSHGAQVAQDVTVTINGANDAPIVTSDAAAASGGVTEDAATPTLSTGGTLAIKDVDLIDTHTATAVFKSSSVSSALSGFGTESHIGTFTIDSSVTESSSDTDGSATLGWHFSLNDNDPVLQSLAEGQTITQVYTVTFTDNHGAAATQDVTVTITGTNDAPKVTAEAGDSAGDNLTETDAGLSSHGTLTVSDVDATDHVKVGLDHVSVYLDGTLQTDGIGGLSNTELLNYLKVPSGDILDGTASHAQFTWDFNSGSQAFDFLAAGHTLTLQYTLVPDDGHTPTGTGNGVVTINIAGSNDAPTLGNATLPSVVGNDTDPAGSTVSDLFAGKFHDVDDGASFKAIAVTSDTAASSEGVWQYEAAGTNQWVDIGSVSDTDALVLGTDALIRFVPANGFTGTPDSLGVHAIDDTYTGAVTTSSAVSIDISGAGHGGTSPVSDQAASIGTDVTPPPDILVAQDDTISNAAAPSGDAGWVLDSENGHYYRIVASEVTWDQANANATGDGAYLATITGQAENSFVASLISGAAWTAGETNNANPAGTYPDADPNASFSWTAGPEAGTAFGYTHWNSGEPNGGFGSTTAGMQISPDGGWNDVPTSWTQGYIEEWGGQQGQVAFRENTGATLTTAQLLGNDTDSAGNPITVTSVGDLFGHTAHGGTVSFNGNIITYTPAADYFGADSFTYTVSDGVKTATATVSFTVDQSPVIDTTHFVHTHNEDGTDTLTDLSVSGPSAETYSLSAVTAGASSSVSPSEDDGASLDQINTDLASVTYTPGQSPPANDMISLTVTDSAGVKDTVNFIFNEGGEGPVTLTGTAGKDVIFATTSNDTLSGGGGRDQFVFAPGYVGFDGDELSSTHFTHTITDFIEGMDKIDLRQFSDVSSIHDLTITQDGGDTLVKWQQKVTVGDSPVIEHEQLTLQNMTATLKASDFIFHIT
jgi:VCBS repeat-containing protein